ncbi:MAG: radical SAM protein, partial [Spirochaetaceae bacterium]|nr:radical SAM protein [Spirochaetaceae bacterium]
MARYINPVTDLGDILLTVEKPARYAGGEAGRLADKEKFLQTVIAFPDLYEIGMSNHALKIIYNRLNALPGVSCDRAFAPVPDFESALAQKNLPLYGLDTGIALNDVTLLMFTFGFELGITALLTMLTVSGIPIKNSARGEDSPIVIAGGLCASNPRPYESFIDAFWIGEAEGGFFSLVSEIYTLKKNGASRGDVLRHIQSHPSVWYMDKKPIHSSGYAAVRAVHTGFTHDFYDAAYPIPSMRIVQQHGVVEIMRGCPNGCRFCQAGAWYRPMRQKDAQVVRREVENLTGKGGFREVSLSSLSSADYTGIDRLVSGLNARYKTRRVSFQLPSLHISTFSLSLLEVISAVRKSGLTFAVETPSEAGQLMLNKKVSSDNIREILIEAKKRGWKSAKFYFMVGLPNPAENIQNMAATDAVIANKGVPPPPESGSNLPSMADLSLTANGIVTPFAYPRRFAPCNLPAASVPPPPESGGKASSDKTPNLKGSPTLADFILELAKRTKMTMNVNVGIFVPKPHTPFERQAQIRDGEERVNGIRARLKPAGHKVNMVNNVMSTVEGLLSRGDGRVGELVEEAFRAGCRLDAWSDYFRADIWERILRENDGLVNDILGPKAPDDKLPWDCIDSGVRRTYLQKEFERGYNGELSPVCAPDCKAPCGVCGGTRDGGKKQVMYNENAPHEAAVEAAEVEAAVPKTDQFAVRRARDRSGIWPLAGQIGADSPVFAGTPAKMRPNLEPQL